MKHKHHIIPKHMGGTDDEDNLVELTREEHAQAHLKLYEQYGKKQDLGAYLLLTGQTDEAQLVACSIGGQIQGKRNAESGHMVNIQKIGSSIGGKKSSEICREKRVNAFFDPVLRNEIARKGGQTQGKNNAESGHLKKIAQLPNKRNEGLIWITDGVSNRMINKTEKIENGWRKGKTQRKTI